MHRHGVVKSVWSDAGYNIVRRRHDDPAARAKPGKVFQPLVYQGKREEGWRCASSSRGQRELQISYPTFIRTK